MQKSLYSKMRSMSSDTLNITALLEAIGKIEVYSQDAVDAEQFYHDQKSFDATMMQFVVMGEAISRLSEDYKESHANVPWQKIKDFRNIIAHDYFGIDADEIWDIVKRKIPQLKSELQRLV